MRSRAPSEGWRMKLRVLIPILVFGIASAQADDKFTCPITRSAPELTLLGTEKLFTFFPSRWQTTQKTGRGYRIPKIVWGTATFDLKQEVGNSSLTITGRRLDAEAGPLEFGNASTVLNPEVSRVGPAPKEERKDLSLSILATTTGIIFSEFYVPTLGCWEVTGHFHGTDLTIVVDLK